MVGLAKQKGIVLIFSVIMLILLTLVSVSMIQQNKQGLSIMGNARARSQAFSDVEGALLASEQSIDEKRQDGDSNLRWCKHTDNEADPNQLDEGDILAYFPETKATSTVTAVYCLAGGLEVKCNYSGGGGREIGDIACDMLYNTGLNPTNPDHPLRRQLAYTDRISTNGCPVEVYAITTKIEDDTVGSGQSIIESKYAVNCTGNADF